MDLIMKGMSDDQEIAFVPACPARRIGNARPGAVLAAQTPGSSFGALISPMRGEMEWRSSATLGFQANGE
jgi:hypothetical protein